MPQHDLLSLYFILVKVTVQLHLIVFIILTYRRSYSGCWQREWGHQWMGDSSHLRNSIEHVHKRKISTLRAILNGDRIHVNFGEFKWIQWWFRSKPAPTCAHWIQVNSENFTEIPTENFSPEFNWLFFDPQNSGEFSPISQLNSTEFTWIHQKSSNFCWLRMTLTLHEEEYVV